MSPNEARARFDAALALARDILTREIAAAASGRRAERIVRAAIAAATDPRVVELGQRAMEAVLVPETSDALFVIYPKRQGFGLEAVPAALGSFENRRDLPAAWGGLEGADLVAATGVPDALFCHAKRFLVVASSHVASPAWPSSRSRRRRPATARRCVKAAPRGARAVAGIDAWPRISRSTARPSGRGSVARSLGRGHAFSPLDVRRAAHRRAGRVGADQRPRQHGADPARIAPTR